VDTTADEADEEFKDYQCPIGKEIMLEPYRPATQKMDETNEIACGHTFDWSQIKGYYEIELNTNG
jgi:hypothetical protein